MIFLLLSVGVKLFIQVFMFFETWIVHNTVVDIKIWGFNYLTFLSHSGHFLPAYLLTLSYPITSDFGGYLGPPYLS